MRRTEGRAPTLGTSVHPRTPAPPAFLTSPEALTPEVIQSAVWVTG